jgi:demethylmacrocin O-methyltransferase
MTTLSEIAKNYPTDKDFTHNYYNRVYEQYFSPIKDDVKLVCEVGIGNPMPDYNVKPGNSLKVWRDYFPNAEILGLDIVKFNDMDDLNRITLDWLDQSKKDLVIEYSTKLNNYDVIIDDGSHNVYDQQITLAHFFKSLKSGGIYVLEDLHTSIEVNIPEKAQLWDWGIPGFITPLELLEHFEKTGEIIADSLNEEEKKYLQDNIASVKVFKDNLESITSVIIKK